MLYFTGKWKGLKKWSENLKEQLDPGAYVAYVPF